jgi:flagellar protein FliO/FliZ
MNPAATNPIAMASPELWGTLIKSAAMLSIVLGLLVGVMFLMRRFFYGKAGAAGRGVIRTIASSHVAPKERIVLIEVLGEKLLLGVTPHAINCLAKISNDAKIDIPVPPPANRFFPNFLKNAISGQHRQNEMDTDGQKR